MTQFDATTSDGTLIAAILAGEERAFSLLVRRYQPALLRTAMSRVGQWHVAEEAVQESFLCAHRWLPTYDSRYSFRTWLWTILLNQCSRLAKREARHAASCDAGKITEAGIPAERDDGAGRGPRCSAVRSPLEEALAREDGERLHALLSRLPEVQADALRLRFFGELTFPEIAAAMDCSESGAKNRVKLGLLQLSKWLRNPVGGAVPLRDCDHA